MIHPRDELWDISARYWSSSPTERLERLAQRQHGLVSAVQASSLGLAPRNLCRSTTRRWVRVRPGLYRLAAVAPSRRQELMAAALMAGPGSVVSHRAAADLQELGVRWTGPVEVTVTLQRHPHLPDVVLHRTRQLGRVDRERLAGIPVTTPTRTIIDLAAVTSPDVVEQALEAALRAGRTSLAHLRSRMDDLAQRGRPGLATLRGVLELRGPGPALESELEVLFVRLLRATGISQGIRQYEVADARGQVARVDMAFPTERVVVELDGWRTHGTPAALTNDLRRHNMISEVLPGWTVLRFSWQDVVVEPEATVATLDRALSSSGSR